MKKRFRHLLWLLAPLLFVGCASTQQFTRLPDQSKIVEDPTKGRIYVMRPSSFGSAVSISIREGDRAIGMTGPGGFLCWEREPGDTTITAQAENASHVDLTVEKGSVYYILQRIEMGMFMAQTRLELINAEEGKRRLSKCKPPDVVK